MKNNNEIMSDNSVKEILSLIIENADRLSLEFTGRQLYRNTANAKQQKEKKQTAKRKYFLANGVLMKIKNAIVGEARFLATCNKVTKTYSNIKPKGSLVNCYE